VATDRKVWITLFKAKTKFMVRFRVGKEDNPNELVSYRIKECLIAFYPHGWFNTTAKVQNNDRRNDLSTAYTLALREHQHGEYDESVFTQKLTIRTAGLMVTNKNGPIEQDASLLTPGDDLLEVEDLDADPKQDECVSFPDLLLENFRILPTNTVEPGGQTLARQSFNIECSACADFSKLCSTASQSLYGTCRSFQERHNASIRVNLGSGDAA
jgi:hypothetical protein